MKAARNSRTPAQRKEKRSQPAESAALAVPVPLVTVAVAGGAPVDEDVKGAEIAPRARTLAPRLSVIDRALGLPSSVPFGLGLLAELVVVCMLGMLIQQQELESFPAYYASLTPSEKLVYGRLGFFNIYHTWYFNLSLLLLSLNIILSSIDHFPKAWSFFRRKKLQASPTFTQAQRVHDLIELPGVGRPELVARACQAARSLRFKVRVTEEESRATVFAERGVWNRFGAYAVHTALLLIFIGGFLTARYGHTGGVWLAPGEVKDRMTQQVFSLDHATNSYAARQQELELPFQLECLDLQQVLIDKNKFIDLGNTVDWLTRVKIRDETGEREALIHLNKPYDYRGYRFFQSSFQPVGSARTIGLRLTPASGGTPQHLTLKLNEETTLADGTRLLYLEFNPDFQLDPQRHPVMASGEYRNPAAHLELIKPTGERQAVWAFTEGFMKTIADAPVMKSALLPAGGPQLVLTDFEKASQAHMLSVQYDPGTNIVYLGFALLCLTLGGVFFFSHQRLWIVVEGGKAYLGGEANRNPAGFEDRVRKMVAFIREPRVAAD